VTSAVIAGIGETEFSKESGRSDLRLNLEASKAAIRDAGLTPKDIDGLIVPTAVNSTTEDLMTNMGIEDLSFTSSMRLGGAGPAAALLHAKLAVESGVARRVLVSYGFNGRSGARLGRKPPTIMFGEAPNHRRNFEGVHGLIVPSQFYALWARRYMHENSWKDTAPMAHVAVTFSKHAVLNGLGPGAREITIDEHQESRMISDPFRLYDCSRETDGGAAYIVTDAREGTQGAVRIRGAAEGRPGQPDQPTTRSQFLRSGMTAAGKRAFSMAGWQPRDIDVAEIYDAFTFNVIWQLEELGLCEPGGGPEFVRDGNIGVDGTLPVNTHGGLIGQAHLWGINHITEAVKQLRGIAGRAQVPGASKALVTGSGDLGDSAVALLEGTDG
jgi:acetyl-CoA acetyltransferase